MKVLVTGAAGFIGSRLSRALLERGDAVIGFDNMDAYYPLVHKQRNLDDLKDFSQFTFIRGDMRTAALLHDVFTQHAPNAVAHLGAMAAVRYSVTHPLLYGDINVQGTVHLLEAARQHGNVPCVLSSTGSVYGRNTPVPFSESAAADQPLAPYPASKRAMELFAHSYVHLWNLPVTILRFFNVYGPHGRPDMMPWQWAVNIHRGQEITLYNNGAIKRDWTYIDDILRGFLAALERTGGYEIFNLGCGNPVENIDFVRILEKLLDRPAKIKDAPVPASEPLITYADIKKARTHLGYEPQFSVEKGLANFIPWMRRWDLL